MARGGAERARDQGMADRPGKARVGAEGLGKGQGGAGWVGTVWSRVRRSRVGGAGWGGDGMSEARRGLEAGQGRAGDHGAGGLWGLWCQDQNRPGSWVVATGPVDWERQGRGPQDLGAGLSNAYPGRISRVGLSAGGRRQGRQLRAYSERIFNVNDSAKIFAHGIAPWASFTQTARCVACRNVCVNNPSKWVLTPFLR